MRFELLNVKAEAEARFGFVIVGSSAIVFQSLRKFATKVAK